MREDETAHCNGLAFHSDTKATYFDVNCMGIKATISSHK
jgi:hypothetical protein